MVATGAGAIGNRHNDWFIETPVGLRFWKEEPGQLASDLEDKKLGPWSGTPVAADGAKSTWFWSAGRSLESMDAILTALLAAMPQARWPALSDKHQPRHPSSFGLDVVAVQQ